MDGDAVDKPKYEELERELHECRAILHAIRSGKVDTVFGEGTRGPAVYTIRNAEIEQENARLIARLEETSRRKSDLLAGISHELRSPLAAAGEFVDLVGESPDLPLKLKRPFLYPRVRASGTSANRSRTESNSFV